MKEKKFYAMKQDELIQKLKTTKNGLTSREARRKLEKDGLNELPHKKPDSILKIFIGVIRSNSSIVNSCYNSIYNSGRICRCYCYNFYYYNRFNNGNIPRKESK